MALGWLIWLAVNTSTQHTKSVNSHTYALFTLFQLWCNRDTYTRPVRSPVTVIAYSLLVPTARPRHRRSPLSLHRLPIASCATRALARPNVVDWNAGPKVIHGQVLVLLGINLWYLSIHLTHKKIDSQTEKWSNSIDEHNSTYHPIMMLPSLTIDDYILLFLTCTPSGDCFIRNIFTQYDQSNIKESDAGAQILLKFHMQPL